MRLQYVAWPVWVPPGSVITDLRLSIVATRQARPDGYGKVTL